MSLPYGFQYNQGRFSWPGMIVKMKDMFSYNAYIMSDKNWRLVLRERLKFRMVP